MIAAPLRANRPCMRNSDWTSQVHQGAASPDSLTVFGSKMLQSSFLYYFPNIPYPLDYVETTTTTVAAGMQSLKEWSRNAASNVILDAAGLIALAELKTIPRRSALTGSASLSDALVLCPGIHRHQTATALNGGEYPITANITSGFVFRVENPATVAYLQGVGKTGHLTTFEVVPDKRAYPGLQQLFDLPGPFWANVLYLAAVGLTIASIVFLIVIVDYWLLAIFLMLMTARLLNVIVIRRRCDANWHGAREAGRGQLLVLLSQDRWIRIKGKTDDLKAVTSGQWLREMTFWEEALEGISIVIVYLSAALGSNGSQVGKFVIIILFMINAGLLTVSNGLKHTLHMKGRVITKSEPAKVYERRLDMTNCLIRESGRNDWAIKMGMINENKIEVATKDMTVEKDEVQV